MMVLTGVFQSYVYQSEVIGIRTKNEPGRLHQILAVLAANKVNIENAYQTLEKNGHAIILIEPTARDLERAKAALADKCDLLTDLIDIGG